MIRRGLSIFFSLMLALGALLVLGAWVEAATPQTAPAAPAFIFVVNSLLDAGDATPGDGLCASTLPGNPCTLRAAVQELNNQAAGGSISLPTGTYVLTDTANGDLQLQKNITLTGAGSSLSIIEGNPAGWAHRILRVQSGANTLVSGVTISGGHPVGVLGGGILVVSGTLALSNSVVSNSSAVSGGGIYATATVTLTNVTLSNNTALSGDGGGMLAVSNLAATNSVFQNNTVITGGSGGGLAAYGSFSGTNVNFVDNTLNSALGSGGGLEAVGALTLTGGQFAHNRDIVYTSYGGGGGLIAYGATSISGTQFLSNTTADWGGGAYIANFSTGSPSVLTNAQFISNSAFAGGGGGLFMWYTSTLTAVNFYSNSAGYHGGGAYAGYGSGYPAVLQGGTMVSNTAPGGGGLYSDSGFTITGTQFLSNTSLNGNGGGAWTPASATVSGTYFAYNTVITGGNSGGLDTGNSLTATNATFYNNHNLFGNGGGSGAGYNATLTNVTYTVNSAQGVGGGLLAFGTASVTSGQFLSNTSGNLGGGLYGTDVVINNGLFQNDRDTGNWGGGVFAYQSALVTSTLFISNAAVFAGGGLAAQFGSCSVVGGSFERNAVSGGGWGGGVYCGGPSLSISGTQFLTNTADHQGGGAYANTAWLTNTTFTNNSATLYGGAAQTSGQLHMLNSLIQNNHSQGNGGGLSASGDITISNTTFISNTTQGDGIFGGGAVASANFITATNSSFTSNTANTSPGGALAAGQTLYLDHSTFSSNVATAGSGGGAFAYAGATLDHATFSGNHSGLNGGGLALTGTATISNSVFTGNSAANGGGLYQYAGDGRIVNSLFAGNTATSAGLQMYLAPTGTLQLLFDTVGGPILALGDAVRITGGSVQVYDTIVTNHLIGLNHVGGTLTQDYNLFFGDTQDTAGGSISGGHLVLTDPLFANPAGNDYHLLAGSPAIDAGVNLGVVTDIDGQARPFGAGFDIGYDEFTLRLLFLPLIRH